MLSAPLYLYRKNPQGGACEFLGFAAEHHLQVITHRYPLDAADQALADLEHGRFEGAAVLVNG